MDGVGSIDAVLHSAIVTNRPPNLRWPSDSRTCEASFMEWTSMTEQLHPSQTSQRAMQSIRCMFLGVTICFSIWHSDGRDGFGGCQDNSTCVAEM